MSSSKKGDDQLSTANIRELSGAELDELLDRLDDDSPVFHRAYKVWEQVNGE